MGGFGIFWLGVECAGCEEFADSGEVGGVESVLEDGYEGWGVIVCREVIVISVVWRRSSLQEEDWGWHCDV